MAKRKKRKNRRRSEKIDYQVNENTTVSGGVGSANGNPVGTAGINTTQGDVSVGGNINTQGQGSVGVGTNQGDVGISGSVNTAGEGTLGVGTTDGDTTYGAGVNTGGNVGVGVQTDVGNNTTVGAGVSTSGNVGVNAGVQGGGVSGNLGVGYNTTTGAVGVTPSIQVGEGQGAAIGGAVGGAAGGIVGGIYGGPWGAAAGYAGGSALGSLAGSQFDPGKDSQQDHARDQVLKAYREAGLLDENYSMTLPDGTRYDFAAETDEREWTNDKKRVVANKPGPTKIKSHTGTNEYTVDINPKYQGGEKLRNWDIDYTNDMDYVAGMAGITLSRIYAGDKVRHVDQVGNMMGNAALGKVGYGADFNRENFNTVMTNSRAMYAKAGVNSKEEMIALANKMYSEKRISDTDYAVMNQTAGLVYDNDFNSATQLMTGRWEGIKTLAETEGGDKNAKEGGGQGTSQDQPQQASDIAPAGGESSSEMDQGAAPVAAGPGESEPAAAMGGGSGNYPGHISSPILSPEEAFLSVQPYIDYAKANIKNPINSASGYQQALAAITGLLSGLGGSKGVGNIIKDLWNLMVGPKDDANQPIGGQQGSGQQSTPPQAPVGNAVEGVGGTQVDLTPSEVGGYNSGYTDAESGNEVFTGGGGYNSGYTDVDTGAEVQTGGDVAYDPGSYDSGYTDAESGDSVFY